MTHIPHALGLIKNSHILYLGGSCFCGLRDLCGINFNGVTLNRLLELCKHIVTVTVDDLDKPAHLPLSLSLSALIAGILLLFHLIARQSLCKHFHQRTISGKIHSKVTLLLLNGNVKANKSLTRTRDTRDKANALLMVFLRAFNHIQNKGRAGVNSGFIGFMLGDILHAMIHVEGRGRLDNCRSGIITAVEPLVSVN